MKVKEAQPVISDIVVIIEGVKYKKSLSVIDDTKYKEFLCLIEVTCHYAGVRGDDFIFTPTTASCEEPYFRMGSGFWEKNFGKRQSNRIKKLCAIAVKEYLDKEEIV